MYKNRLFKAVFYLRNTVDLNYDSIDRFFTIHNSKIRKSPCNIGKKGL
jgi:hypothetical protein